MSDPLRGKWYPLLPSCPHCARSDRPRSTSDTGLCVVCNASHQISRRSEDLLPGLEPAQWRLYQNDPDKWLAYQMGRSYQASLPPIARATEAHRLMHLLICRFHGAEENEISYDALTTLDPWTYDNDDGLSGMDQQQDEHDSEFLRTQRERHNLNVRIWRTKFNTKVARPLIAWLKSANAQIASDGIERTNNTTAGGWEVTLILHALVKPVRFTEWALIFTKGWRDIHCWGMGMELPGHITVMDNLVHTTELPFSHATLLDLMR